MKKNRKQPKMLRDFYKDACSSQQMQQIKGGNCCNESDNDGHPPPPPSAMARVVPLWQKWGSK
ncbi:hypothetical protein [uncultured Microscilla sp.]|uniref:hypothetical protein n=1 Tax=uncultured Microscilla sp. TaxID=432653 RepID=UPI002637A86D|nr:hypothetical protein [uncultured Microscilla sp.]